MREQPSGRLGQSCHDDEDDESKEDLEGDWETPDEVVRTVGAAIVNPVSDKRADSDVATFDTDDLASVVGLGALGLVGRDCRCVDTVSELIYELVTFFGECLDSQLTPVMNRPTMNCAVLPELVPTQHTWMITPIIMTEAPMKIDLRRPSLSPSVRMKIAPKRQPTAYIETMKPCQLLPQPASGKSSRNASDSMIPDMTPWS